MEKISSADLLTQVQGLYKSNRVYSFVKDLDVDSNTAMMILDFIKDYGEDFEQSRRSDKQYYREKINRLEGLCDAAAIRLREVASLLEPGED